MFKSFKNNIKYQLEHPKRLIICIIILIILFVSLTRILDFILLNRSNKNDSMPLVAVTFAKKPAITEELVLPGILKAWHEAPIYARTNGYIKQWYVDIGYKVKKDALLAIIETPELDAQLRQAEADLTAVIAQNNLAQLTAKRWLKLLKSDSVSKQETEDKVHAAEVLNATVIANRANRDRLRELVGFERVTAPFSGTISERGIDIGDLINAGFNSSTKPLFRIVQTNDLRLYVKIPELYTPRISPKMKVTLKFAEHPGQVFKASLIKTADALNPNTSTLLAQFAVHNPKDILLPGSYTEVTFSMRSPPNLMTLPANAFLFRKEGLQVAMLSQNNRVILKDVAVYRDFGEYLEIIGPIKETDRIIINPSDAIYNGEKVQVGDKKLQSLT